MEKTVENLSVFILLVYWSVIILAPVFKNSDKKLENIIYPTKKPNK